MAHLPTFEEILSEVHVRFGLKALTEKSRFTGYEMEKDRHAQRIQSLLQQIYGALELDERAQKEARRKGNELRDILKAIGRNTWTGNASQQQVLWHTLACIHVPVWARNIARWSLYNVEHDLPPIDAGMPGGEFWFLPTHNQVAGKVEMPLAKVLAWLLDLLEEPSLACGASRLAGDAFKGSEVDPESLTRKLRYWCTTNKPQSADEIEKLFPEGLDLIFPGALPSAKDKTPDEQFENALKFVVDRRKLSVEQLSGQIPMTPERLRPVFDCSASEKEKATFVQHVAIRYAAPDMATVRQRLRVARLVQAGYDDLVKCFCPVLLQEQVHDPRQNKVLQLIGLFETIYNKTIQAWHHGDTESAQDAWFENQFSPWDRYDLLLPILSSLPWEARVSLLAERLTRRFLSLQPEHGLEDILPTSEADLEDVLRPRVECIQRETEEDRKSVV